MNKKTKVGLDKIKLIPTGKQLQHLEDAIKTHANVFDFSSGVLALVSTLDMCGLEDIVTSTLRTNHLRELYRNCAPSFSENTGRAIQQAFNLFSRQVRGLKPSHAPASLPVGADYFYQTTCDYSGNNIRYDIEVGYIEMEMETVENYKFFVAFVKEGDDYYAVIEYLYGVVNGQV